MRNKDKALEGMEQVVIEVGHNILEAPEGRLLNSYEATIGGLSEAAPINILPDRTVPLTDTSIVMAHNAYNSLSEGALWPNQQLSITELLDIGVRGLELDVHWNNGDVRMCHELCTPRYTDIVLGLNRPLADALQEVQAWLNNHPTETIILKFEDYLNPVRHGAPPGELGNVIRSNLNTTSIFTPSDLSSAFHGTWPSIDQMNALGKQIILMPQNSGEDPSLFFGGGWGGRFKNPFNTGTIARVRPSNLTIPRRATTQLIEVGEDKSFLGWLVDSARKIPVVGGFIPHDTVAGQMTKEEIQQLRANGVNLISLDKIEHNDPRLSSSFTLSDLKNNAYVFIPVAIAAAALTPRDHGDRLLSTTAQRTMIQLLVATTLPDEARVLYNATDAGISAYNASAEEISKAKGIMTVFDKVKAVGYSLLAAVGKAIETIGKIGLSNITAQSINTGTIAPTTMLGTAAKTSVNVIATKIITDPIIGTVKGLVTGKGMVHGFLDGVDSSTFGLTSFGSKKDQHPVQRPIPTPSSTTVTTTIQEHEAASSTRPDNSPSTTVRRRNVGTTHS
jgi:hypothetical protein